MRCDNLHKAKGIKNDEFYTLLSDIEKELSHYLRHFKDKIVYCNCDDPTWSAFWKYFHLNFAKLGLKKLLSTHYDRENRAYKMIYTGGDDDDLSVGAVTYLNGDGDFRSPECIELLKETDIVVTNPPFSLFREYIATLMNYQKKFLIIVGKNAITYKDFFSLLKNEKVWLGYNNVHEFLQPDGSIKKFGNIGWFTNLDITKRHEKLILSKHYDSQKYLKYDNYNAINVDKVSEIPYDYTGVMGVPITYLDKHNPEQFEILGYTSGRVEYDVLAHPTKRYVNALQHNKDGSVSSGSKVNTRATIIVTNPRGIYYTADNSSEKLIVLYARILIRRKQNDLFPQT